MNKLQRTFVTHGIYMTLSANEQVAIIAAIAMDALCCI
jgi:hypothetical protein